MPITAVCSSSIATGQDCSFRYKSFFPIVPTLPLLLFRRQAAAAEHGASTAPPKVKLRGLTRRQAKKHAKKGSGSLSCPGFENDVATTPSADMQEGTIAT